MVWCKCFVSYLKVNINRYLVLFTCYRIIKYNAYQIRCHLYIRLQFLITSGMFSYMNRANTYHFSIQSFFQIDTSFGRFSKSPQCQHWLWRWKDIGENLTGCIHIAYFMAKNTQRSYASLVREVYSKNWHFLRENVLHRCFFQSRKSTHCSKKWKITLL